MNNFSKISCSFLLISLVFFPACSSTNGQTSTGDSFTKKQECAQYKSQLEIDVKNRYFLNTTTGYEMQFTLDKLFYSPKVNSCLYVVTESDWNIFDDSLGSFISQTPCLMDVLTGETILCELREASSDDFYDKKHDFEQRVSEYE